MRRVVFLVLLFLLPACASYRIAIEPPPLPSLPARPMGAGVALAIEVESCYAPFRDGELGAERFPRNRRLGEEDRRRYQEAFRATRQFCSIDVAPRGQGLHCHLQILSGREPARQLCRVLSILLTVGLWPHEQREIIELAATVSAPGRADATYRLRGLVTTDATGADDTRLRRPDELTGPERDLVAALVARMANDGWLPGVVR